MRIPLKQYSALLINYLKPQWPKVFLLAALLFSGIGLQLANPQVLRYFIDTATSGGAPETLTRAALLFIGIALTNQVLSTLATYVSENVGWTATNMLRADLVRHCLRLDVSFHKAHTPGELIERIDGDVTVLSNFFSQFVIRMLSNVILLSGVLILLFREDWRTGLALTTFTVVVLTILSSIRDISVPHWKASRQASADFFGFLGERLSGIEDIRSNGANAYVMQRFYSYVREWAQKDLKASLIGSIFWNTTTVLCTLGTAVVLVMGAYLFKANVISIGTVYLMFHYTQMLRQPMEKITFQMNDLQKVSANIARIQEITHTPCKIPDRSDAHLPSGAMSVKFDNVSFGYVEQEVVLRNLLFHLQPGVALGLLGRTGSGKSTLARLLFRLYDPNSGTIRLNDVDIREVSLSDLRQRVGIVTQDVQLFHATVRDNLTFFDKTIPDEQILQVIQELGLSSWYQSMSKGLDTELTTGGSGLSAGEAQLLAFTRVFLKDPGLVILDEASSRLDPVTEQLIERAVDKLLHNRTAIIIAHRLATVHRADEIMIFKDGSICEHGVREQLMNNSNSRFYRLLQTGLEGVLA